MGRRSPSSSPSASRSPPRNRDRRESRDRRDSRDRRRSDRRGDRSRSRSRDRSSRRGDPVPQSLLVRGLPANITADQLRDKFSRRNGDIRDVYIPKDHATGEPRGFAFLEFHDIREAREVKQSMDRTIIDGAEVGVLFAQQRRKTPEQMRQQEQEGRSGGGGDVAHRPVVVHVRPPRLKNDDTDAAVAIVAVPDVAKAARSAEIGPLINTTRHMSDGATKKPPVHTLVHILKTAMLLIPHEQVCAF
ncbi:hypothetical protein AaE_004507 [Aphanomyces astaci]|uniref:RRM domain-containing protein n=1 Tax=Aphanomyces astaci TaxID=112090 RepID=A0A6A5ARD8_APHAT|nr:hypothetical protein AaE_004507 [Aphanomyces astaci]